MPNFPDITKMTAALAGNNRLVTKFIDSLGRRVDDMVDAAGQGRWDEVGRIGGYIARSSGRYGQPEIAKAADNVRRMVDSARSEADIKACQAGSA